MGQRAEATFRLPLCDSCRKRAAARSDEEKTARLQAHLIAALIGVVLVVGALAVRLVSFRESPVVDAITLGILLVLGYAPTLLILLNRASRHSPPPDAAYVRSTLLIPTDVQGVETAFEWRSEGYAKRFHQANWQNIVGDVTPVKDRAAPPED
jgi:hypothetical protein